VDRAAVFRTTLNIVFGVCGLWLWYGFGWLSVCSGQWEECTTSLLSFIYDAVSHWSSGIVAITTLADVIIRVEPYRDVRPPLAIPANLIVPVIVKSFQSVLL